MSAECGSDEVAEIADELLMVETKARNELAIQSKLWTPLFN
jgi:hypothetical protein